MGGQTVPLWQSFIGQGQVAVDLFFFTPVLPPAAKAAVLSMAMAMMEKNIFFILF
jgi:hypothetical protein